MRTTTTLGAMACALMTIAQPKTDKATIQWGEEQTEKTTGTYGTLFGQNDDAVHMTFWKKDDLFIRKMTADLANAYLVPVDLKLDKKDLQLREAMVAGDHIILFAERYDKKEDLRTLYMRSYRESDMVPTGPWERLAEFSSGKAYAGGFQMDVSPNEEHILVSIFLPYDKDGAEKFRLRVYDRRMAPVWDREVTMPYTDKEFVVEDLRVENDGDVVALGMKYAEKQEARRMKREGQATYDYHLITFSADGTHLDNTIHGGDRFLQDLTISLDKGLGPILCGGLYGTKESNKVRGAFFMSLDPRTKAVIHESYQAFSDDLITQYMTAREEAKAKKKAEKKDEDLQLFEYDLDEIIRRDDGGAVLVGEQYYSYTTTVCTPTQNGGQSCHTVSHYIHNDIIVVNMDPKGDIEWATTIPKRQHTTNDGGYYSSYTVGVKGDRLHFIFNDNAENLFRSAGDKFKPMDLGGKASVVTMATVSRDGHVVREALMDPEKRDLILRPKGSHQLADDRMFIYATRKRDYRFGLVSFQ